MKLYGYFRSSAAFRVRIALNLKGLSYDQTSIHLRHNDQAKPDYRAEPGSRPSLCLQPKRCPRTNHDPAGSRPDPLGLEQRAPQPLHMGFLPR